MGIFRSSAARKTQDGGRGLSPRANPGKEQLLLKELSHTPSSSGSTQLSSKCGDLRYVKFNISTVPGAKHAVFVPEGRPLTPALLSQVCGALGREVPSGLLRGVGSLRHPARMSSAQLRACPGFRELMGEARQGLGAGRREVNRQPSSDSAGLCTRCSRPRTGGAEGELRVGGPEEATVVAVADGLLEKRLASAMDAVASAAVRANVWTLTGPRITGFELLLQQCIESGGGEGGADVFRLSIAHAQDRAYMEYEHSRRLMKQLFDASEAMSAELVEKARPVTLQGDIWDQAKNTAHREFFEHGYDYWSFETYEDSTLRGHPITQWPWPYADLFLLFYREESPPAPAGPYEADWAYATPARLDQEAVPFAPEALAPVGHIFLGGSEPRMKRRMLQAMKASMPMVLVDNTPNVPKQFSAFISAIKKAWERAPALACAPFIGNAADLGSNPTSGEIIQAMLPSKLLKHVEQEFDSSGMDPDEKLTLSDVVGLLDLARRKPQVFQEACVVDPLHFSVDEAATQFAMAFTSHHGGVRSFGAAAVEGSLVVQGWRLHRRLARAAQQLYLRSVALLVAVALALFAGIALSVCVVSLGLDLPPERLKGPEEISAPLPRAELKISYTPQDVALLRVALLALPVLAGLLAALQGWLKSTQRWGIAQTCASRVVAEIYQFRGGVGQYCDSPSVNQQRFLKRLQDVGKQLAQGGVREDDLPGGADAYAEGFPKDMEELQQHINRHLYGVSPPGWLRRKARDLATIFGACKWSALLLEGQEARDLTAPLTAEVYMETRLEPLKQHYLERVHSLTRLATGLHVTLLVCLGIAALLGAAGLALWVPVPLALATLVATLARCLAAPEHIAIVSDALMSLDRLDRRWQESNIREHRSEATRSRLIISTERAAQAVAAVCSCAAFTPDEEEEEETEEAKQVAARTKSRERMRPISLSAAASSTPSQTLSGSTTPL